MKTIEFVKMVASGNDFIIVESPVPSEVEGLSRCSVDSLKKLARKICDRRYGIGADGLLVLEKSKIADVKMRVFNADGSEAEMCGNGARCVALWQRPEARGQRPEIIKIETKAGIIEAQVSGDNVKIKLTHLRDLKLDMPIKINNRLLHVNFINTGVPHAVVFVQGLEKIDVVNIGRQIRRHNKFMPQGTNVDFVEALGPHAVKIRTYERGVEDETLACGTGSVAAALLYAIRSTLSTMNRINIHTRSGEILKVYFERIGKEFKNIWLEGKAKIVYTGEINV